MSYKSKSCAPVAYRDREDRMSLDVALTCGHCNGELFSANITHNLNAMAEAVGIYKPVWRPDENGIRHASDLIDILETGIAKMKADPAKFKEMDPENGWGSYDNFLPWLESYLEACKKYPKAVIGACR